MIGHPEDTKLAGASARAGSGTGDRGQVRWGDRRQEPGQVWGQAAGLRSGLETGGRAQIRWWTGDRAQVRSGDRRQGPGQARGQAAGGKSGRGTGDSGQVRSGGDQVRYVDRWQGSVRVGGPTVGVRPDLVHDPAACPPT